MSKITGLKQWAKNNKRVLITLALGAVAAGSGAALAPGAIPVLTEIVCQAIGGC